MDYPVREVIQFKYDMYLFHNKFILCTDNCSQLMDPVNGTMSCSLLYSPLILYEDTCSFTCNNGYDLTGSDTRICQSDGSWSGSDDVCRRGKFMIIINNFIIFIS